MRIWIDLGNSPHVPFFSGIAGEFKKEGHVILWTARDYAQTVALAEKAGLGARVFGSHGGKSLFNKGFKFGSRILSLAKWARGKEIDLVVSHNSHEPLVVSKLLSAKSVNLMDYEHHPANHLSFRLADRIIVPESFPDEFLRKFGAGNKSMKFDGIKEDVYLADFSPDEHFYKELRSIGIETKDILVIVRPHADEALYHRGYANVFLEQVLNELMSHEEVKVVLLPRKQEAARDLRIKYANSNIIVPEHVLDGANLLYAADLVISGGGTMNRESAALGTPTATIFSGKPAAIDDYLLREKRLWKIESMDDFRSLDLIKKKTKQEIRGRTDLKKTIADLILNKQESGN